jgi:hypothetical protein
MRTQKVGKFENRGKKKKKTKFLISINIVDGGLGV